MTNREYKKVTDKLNAMKKFSEIVYEYYYGNLMNELRLRLIQMKLEALNEQNGKAS